MDEGGEASEVAAPAPFRRLEEAMLNRIVTGEVIQPPSSALKELLENSLVAGATSIGITVKDGGLKLIQIADNGHGILTVSTLGFKCGALTSITFVALLSATTMTEGQAHSYKTTYKDGLMEGDPPPCAAVKGTQITNLFYNLAARRKAFKNPGEENGRILDVVSRYAVHKIGVSFSCKKMSLLDQESLVDTIQQAVEAEVLESNNSRTFSTQISRVLHWCNL